MEWNGYLSPRTFSVREPPRLRARVRRARGTSWSPRLPGRRHGLPGRPELDDAWGHPLPPDRDPPLVLHRHRRRRRSVRGSRARRIQGRDRERPGIGALVPPEGRAAGGSRHDLLLLRRRLRGHRLGVRQPGPLGAGRSAASCELRPAVQQGPVAAQGGSFIPRAVSRNRRRAQILGRGAGFHSR